MALASLYARSRAGFDIEHASAQKNRHLLDSGPMRIDRPPAFAFIVDHKVRPESTEEAEWVAEQCRSKCKYYFAAASQTTHVDMR